uniref:Uncharacterized protein n=1 Tax=Timema monikensis TaxID=170555 RepID=A0A7R9HP80_9NEOP|nr:unnamed protein product [Timema monikensis]
MCIVLRINNYERCKHGTDMIHKEATLAYRSKHGTDMIHKEATLAYRCKHGTDMIHKEATLAYRCRHGTDMIHKEATLAYSFRHAQKCNWSKRQNSFHIRTERFPLILLQDTMRAIFSVSTGPQLDQTALDNMTPKAGRLLFSRTESSGDWSLHLSCVCSILLYLHAAGHLHYAKSYLQQMSELSCIMNKDDFEAYCSKAIELSAGQLVTVIAIDTDILTMLGVRALSSNKLFLPIPGKTDKPDKIHNILELQEALGPELVPVMIFLPTAPGKLLHLICCGCECKKSMLYNVSLFGRRVLIHTAVTTYTSHEVMSHHALSYLQQHIFRER